MWKPVQVFVWQGEVEDWENMPPDLQRLVLGQNRALERLRAYNLELIKYLQTN
jgi:hypothetical protein